MWANGAAETPGYKLEAGTHRLMTLSSTLQRLAWLGLLGFLCLFVGYVLEHVEGEVPHLAALLIRDMGVAALIAFFLAVTIDRLFRQEALADVARAALGYALPPILRDELRWLYEQQFIATETVYTVDITLNGDGESVAMRGGLQRHVENITNVTQHPEIGVGIDEWGFATPSRILHFGYQIGDENWIEVDTAGVKRTAKGWAIDPIRIAVPPGGAFEQVVSIEEIRRRNDEHRFTLRYASKTPRVIIHAPSELAVEVMFSHRAQAEVVPTGLNTYRLNGTLLPEQGVAVRWWPQAQDSDGGTKQANPPSQSVRFG